MIIIDLHSNTGVRLAKEFCNPKQEPLESEARARLFYTYILICADDTLYTGWTRDIEQRLQAHNSGKGAKYTRSRLPVRILISWQFDTKSEAMRMEYRIKKLPRQRKLLLANDLSARSMANPK